MKYSLVLKTLGIISFLIIFMIGFFHQNYQLSELQFISGLCFGCVGMVLLIAAKVCEIQEIKKNIVSGKLTTEGLIVLEEPASGKVFTLIKGSHTLVPLVKTPHGTYTTQPQA